MDRAQTAEGDFGDIKIEKGVGQLQGRIETRAHAQEAPDQGHDGKFTDDFVVVFLRGRNAAVCHGLPQ